MTSLNIDSSTVLTRICPVCNTCHSGPLCSEQLGHTGSAATALDRIEARLLKYDATLRAIEEFGHRGGGHGMGYRCADMAAEALTDETNNGEQS